MKLKTNQDIINLLGKTVKLRELVPLKRDVMPSKGRPIVEIVAIDEIEESNKGFLEIRKVFKEPEYVLDEFTYVIFWCKEDSGKYVQIVNWEIDRVINDDT